MQAQGVQVQGAVTDGVSGRFGTRGNIAIDLVGATHKGIGAHLIALLNGGNAADSRIFADAHVAAQLAAVRNNDSLTDIAVMSNMRVGHHKHLVCHMGAAAPLYRTTVKRAIFANCAIFANFESSRLARILQILRRASQNGSIVNMGIFPDRNPAIDMHAGL